MTLRTPRLKPVLEVQPILPTLGVIWKSVDDLPRTEHRPADPGVCFTFSGNSPGPTPPRRGGHCDGRAPGNAPFGRARARLDSSVHPRRAVRLPRLRHDGRHRHAGRRWRPARCRQPRGRGDLVGRRNRLHPGRDPPPLRHTRPRALQRRTVDHGAGRTLSARLGRRAPRHARGAGRHRHAPGVRRHQTPALRGHRGGRRQHSPQLRAHLPGRSRRGGRRPGNGAVGDGHGRMAGVRRREDRPGKRSLAGPEPARNPRSARPVVAAHRADGLPASVHPRRDRRRHESRWPPTR